MKTCAQTRHPNSVADGVDLLLDLRFAKARQVKITFVSEKYSSSFSPLDSWNKFYFIMGRHKTADLMLNVVNSVQD